MKYTINQEITTKKMKTDQQITNALAVKLLLSYEFIPSLLLAPVMYIFTSAQKPLDNGIIMCIVSIIGLFFVKGYRNKWLKNDEMFQVKKKMNKKSLMIFILLLLACQAIFNIIATLGEQLLNLVGLSMIDAISEGSVSMDQSVYILFYGAFVAPIFEEILCRGTLMHQFTKYGKVYAIVFSSLLFGILHGNIPQGLFAFAMGLILGYVAMEYSLGWAIFLHFFNNGLFGMGMGFLALQFGQVIESLQVIILVIAMVLSGVILFKKKDDIKNYLKNHATKPSKTMNGWFIAFIIIHGLVALSSITFYTPLNTL